MKQIRLEFPVYQRDNDSFYLPTRIWLKVEGNITRAFEDKEFKNPLPNADSKISVEVEVEENLERISVRPSTEVIPVQEISADWDKKMANPNWKIPGLQKVVIILDKDMSREVQVIDERPDLEGWREYTERDRNGMWLFISLWALKIYTINSETRATFHWHSKFASVQKWLAIV